MKNVLVVGSINMDLTVHTGKLPKMGETIFAESFSAQQGGKGANQAVAIKKMGCNTKMIGAVGNDIYGNQLLKNLSDSGIEFEGYVLDGVSSGVAVITVYEGDNCIIVESGANSKLTPALIEKKEELFGWADYVVMQFEIPMETVVFCAKKAKEYGAKVILNPAPTKEIPDELYSCVDLIVPNEHEVFDITGIKPSDEKTAVEAIKALLSKGVDNAIITLGEKGCVYTDGGEIKFAPAVKTKAVDTTAAGDSFIGAFTSKIAEGKSVDEAIEFAAKVSSITVSRPGASDSIPTADEIK